MAEYHYREAAGASETAPLFFVFHGTGGDENQFFALAGQLLPGARIVAPRGAIPMAPISWPRCSSRRRICSTPAY